MRLVFVRIHIFICTLIAFTAFTCQKRMASNPTDIQPGFDPATGPVLVHIVDAQTQTPLGDARISINSTPTGLKTNNEGYAFYAAVTSGNQVLRVTLSGYEPGFARIAVSPRSTGVTTVHLMRAKTIRLMEDSQVVRIDEPGYTIQIPSRAFGGSPTQPVQVRYTMAEPTPTGIRAMPGSFRGVPQNGGTDVPDSVPLESFGAISISAFRGGQEVNLVPGKTIHVRFACQAACAGKNPPTTVPLWSLDESTGLWKEEGVARVVREKNNEYWLEADLPHLSWWNADRPLYDKTSILVHRVTDYKDKNLSNALLTAEGVNKLFTISGSFDIQETEGDSLCLEVPPNTRIRLARRYAF